VSAPHRTRLLVIDALALVRKTLTHGLAGAATVEVVANASSARLAMRKIPRARPDVILLDLRPPLEPEIACLQEIATYAALPMVLLTSLGQSERRTVIEALNIRRSLVLAKPGTGLVEGLGTMMAAIEAAVRRAHLEEWRRWRAKRRRIVAPPAVTPPGRDRIIAIGASTGGTEAIAEILGQLPRATPGVVIVQHMPSGFTRMFAERLNELSELEVKEAEDGDEVRPGRALLAPGGSQMRIVAAGLGYRVRVEHAPRVNGHCPSVDVLLRSVAEHARAAAIGVILTGMGDDGADGLRRVHEAGATTLAQDEASCVVFGMPKAARDRGGVDRLLPLREIPRALLSSRTRR
jgi:two-component system chemotaxis response regulator CheB